MSEQFLTISLVVVSALLVILSSVLTSKSRTFRTVLLLIGDIGLVVYHFVYLSRQNLNLTFGYIFFATINIVILNQLYGNNQVDQRMFEKWNKDPANWKLGVFYYNRKDSRIFPPKRFGIGWTINFGNPLAIIVFIFLILALTSITKH